MHAASLFLFWTLAALKIHEKCRSGPSAQCYEITVDGKAGESLFPSGRTELAGLATGSHESSPAETSVLERAAHNTSIAESSKNHRELRNTSHSELRNKNHSEQQKQAWMQWNLQFDRMLLRRDRWSLTMDIRWLLFGVLLIVCMVAWLFSSGRNDEPLYEDRFAHPSSPRARPYTQRRFDEAMKERGEASTRSRRAGSEAGTPAMRGAGFTPKARTPLSGRNGSASVDTPSSGARQSPKERPSMIVEENAESSS